MVPKGFAVRNFASSNHDGRRVFAKIALDLDIDPVTSLSLDSACVDELACIDFFLFQTFVDFLIDFLCANSVFFCSK